MPGLANDFVADAAVDAAFAGFAQMGLVKGTAAAVITPIAAGVVSWPCRWWLSAGWAIWCCVHWMMARSRIRQPTAGRMSPPATA
jgi:hypothetical protein